MLCHKFGDIVEYTPKSRQGTFVLKDPEGDGKTECRFENPNKDLGVVIQPSVVTGEQSTNCDFLLLNCDSKTAYFVELKGGTEFRKATEQILYSIKSLRKGIANYSIVNAIIIQTKSRKSTVNAPKNFYKKMILEINKLNGEFKHFSQTHTETL
jgi:hypothetical protein